MRILLIDFVIFLKTTDIACCFMMVTPFYDKSYEKNMQNLQTKIYSEFFSDFEYLAPLHSNEIYFRVSSEKTYCRYHYQCRYHYHMRTIELWSVLKCRWTRPDTRLPQSGLGGQGLYLRSLDHLGRSRKCTVLVLEQNQWHIKSRYDKLRL